MIFVVFKCVKHRNKKVKIRPFKINEIEKICIIFKLLKFMTEI